MRITVNVEGQLSQIKLSQSKALWPLFETIINSIQSLEDTDTSDKTIFIEAIRDTDIQMKLDSKGKSVEEQAHFNEFVVTDNGNGFDSINYQSFLEAYSRLKVKKGCKGIGRFLWLKAFDSVTIDSILFENNKWYRRSFEFTTEGVKPEDNLKMFNHEDGKRITKVHLRGFKSVYRDSVAYSLESLAKKIIEHCLPYFIMEICPAIILRERDGDSININSYYEKVYKDSIHQDLMILRNQEYILYHMMVKEGAEKHELHLCANNREVKSVDISKRIPNLQKRITTEEGNFYYVGYLVGAYLDEGINMERSEFEFADIPILGKDRPALEEDIIEAAVEHIKLYLEEDLAKIGYEKKKQIDRLVQSKKPQYRLLLNKRPGVYDKIPMGLSDEKLDQELYKYQQEWEFDTVKQKQDIEEKIKNDATTDPDFESIFEAYCQSITDLSRASLAEYVVRRKAVIDLFENALEKNGDGKYSLESRIHSIICPMQISSDEIKFEDMNLWLIDDRLAYHHYLASDKKINTLPVLDSDVDKRMDLAIFDAALSYTANPEEISSITIVELKRPQRNDLCSEDKDPVWQVLKYVRDIREGKVKKANGRGFGDMSHVSFYCYVIGDITPTMKESAEGRGLIETQDRQGYFGYNSAYGAYVEVISYDKLLKDAKQRNRVLFDKLFNPKVNDLVYNE